jgi:4-hydroxy-3-polyprenylbenzoate decarboxylase
MLLWRVSNNIDAQRDIYVSGVMVGVDGTNKNQLDNFDREWPGDVECTPSVIASLKEKGVWDLEEKLLQKYQL